MSSSSDDPTRRLQRCIRDLASLHALSSMCIGCTTEEALGNIADALPTALVSELVYLALPGNPPTERGSFCHVPLSPDQLAHVAGAVVPGADGDPARLSMSGRTLYCVDAEIPYGRQRGRLVVGRTTPLHHDTDRILVRTAANVVGTILTSAEVLEAARRKDDFLAILGHELRNPLAPIVTAVELLARHPHVDREREVIGRNARHLGRLVDDLLDISRVTRGHLELRREVVLLDTVLDRAVELASPLIIRNGHDLRVERVEDITVEGDLVRLAQIFGNLLNNAAKFTAPGGRIDVTVRRAGGRVAVTVRDNGRGIERDEIAGIFEPFVQVDRERDALRGGLGLGLAIVNSLVQLHGGAVTVESRGRGHGAAFTVELPVAAQPQDVHEPSLVQPAQARAGLRVLVVDDNVDIAELLSEALRHHGFDTSVAHDGSTALERWRTFRPHAGILDVGLPDLDGYELARTLRGEHGADATLIAATGYGQQSDRERAAESGFDFHLVKPVGVGALLQVLDDRLLVTKPR